MKSRYKRILATVLCAVMCLVGFSLHAFASYSQEDYTIIALLEWLDSEDCSIELTEAQASDVDTALSLYNTYTDCFDLSDDDDAADLDHVLKALDQIDTLSALVTTDDNFEGYSAFYTNFTMLTGSAYTANVSIDKMAHVSTYTSFSSTEGLAWGYTDPSSGWYTMEKGYFDTYKSSLGYSGYITYGGSEYQAIVGAATSAGQETGHYTNLFFCGTIQLIGVGYTTEKGDLGYSKTWSYNTATISNSKSGGATYTTDAIRAVIATYTCEVVNDGDHTWDDGEVTTAATCTEDGVMTYTCTVCGTTKTEAISATGHSYEAVVTNPTCTEGGYTTYTCSVCGDTYTDDETEATGHSYEAVVTEPTCTEGGYTTYTCSVCGDTYTADETEATGHRYEAVVTEPTCTEGGYTTYTCSVCGDTYTADETEATGHSYEATETVEATCTEDGYVDYTCSACGDSYTETLEATGHSYEATETVEATCTEDGYVDYTCSACGDSYTETLEATGHSYEATETVDATCTEDGYVVYTCSTCGDDYTKVAEALGHDYVSTYTAPTHTDDGYTTYVCSRCGDTYTISDNGTATGHDYSAAWTWGEDYSTAVLTLTCNDDGDTQTITTVTISSKATDATCVTDAYTTYTASAVYDGVEYSDVQVVTDAGSATGHSYAVGGWTWTGSGSSAALSFTCSNCGSQMSVTADVTGTVTTEATCTGDGVLICTATVVYDDVEYTDTTAFTIAATGHSWNYDDVSVTWADDYSSVSVIWTCAVCGETYIATDCVITSVKDEDGSITYTVLCTDPESDSYTSSVKVETTDDDSDDSTTGSSNSSDNSSDSVAAVSTGDNTNVIFWFTILAAAVTCILIGKKKVAD